MTRRSFLTKTAVAGAAIVAGGIIKWRYFGPRKPPLSFPLILSSFCDEETMRKIGLRYLLLVPAENSKAALLAGLSREIDPVREEAPLPLDLARAVETKVEEDFRAQKFLVLNHWIISRTEARQCALLALS